MAGFFGLFGSKSKDNNQTKSNKEAFFLDSDDAKSLGDIDYMRQSKTITRTFPKTKSNPKGAKSVKDISSMSVNNGKAQPDYLSKTPANNTSKSESKLTDTNLEAKSRRETDTSMDMFRKMAREIKK